MIFFSIPSRSSVLLLVLLGGFMGCQTAGAQVPFGSLIETLKSDGNKILQAYANPFLKRHGDGWSDG